MNNCSDIIITSNIKSISSEAILTYYSQIFSESNFLLFDGKSFLDMNEKQQKNFITNLNNETNYSFFAIMENVIVGNISINFHRVKRIKHNAQIALSVKQKYQNKGIASLLLKKVIAKFGEKTNILLIVREDNLKAIHLYEKFDFKKSGYLKNYFKINNLYYGACIMEREMI